MGGKSAAAKPHASVPVLACQVFLRLALLPIRPGEGANDAAASARHARTEGWDSHVIAEAIHVQHSIVVAELADHP
jgi:hypothetical protein